jgi:hypothetical protein
LKTVGMPVAVLADIRACSRVDGAIDEGVVGPLISYRKYS